MRGRERGRREERRSHLLRGWRENHTGRGLHVFAALSVIFRSELGIIMQKPYNTFYFMLDNSRMGRREALNPGGK